jgi:hypothetical protein
MSENLDTSTNRGFRGVSSLKNYDLMFELFKPNGSGGITLDLDVARKPVRDDEFGAKNVLEALFSRLPASEALTMFRILRSYENIATS